MLSLFQLLRGDMMQSKKHGAISMCGLSKPRSRVPCFADQVQDSLPEAQTIIFIDQRGKLPCLG